MNRTVSRVERPVPEPGFLGEGHTAVPVIRAEQFERNDPFIALMDDHIHLKGDRPAGGPHPHAGFETVTFVLEGKLEYHDRNSEGHLEAGDIQWMTAGRGVIHTETMERAVESSHPSVVAHAPEEGSVDRACLAGTSGKVCPDAAGARRGAQALQRKLRRLEIVNS